MKGLMLPEVYFPLSATPIPTKLFWSSYRAFQRDCRVIPSWLPLTEPATGCNLGIVRGEGREDMASGSLTWEPVGQALNVGKVAFTLEPNQPVSARVSNYSSPRKSVLHSQVGCS